jgi:hypothetical protein
MTQEVLKQALEALEGADWYINQLELIVYSVDDEGTHENRVKVQSAITAIKEALAQPQQEPVAREPNDAELLKAFTRSNNGPNPFYRCNTCGDTEPGVREYLSNHWLKHNNTSPPQRKPLTHEKEIALREGYFADAEKTYFEARADCLNSAQNRRLFEAGFKRGWEAAHGIKE